MCCVWWIPSLPGDPLDAFAAFLADLCKVIHGLMCRVDDEGDIREARILDLASAGAEGTAKYPGFLNGRANWPLAAPDGQPITQALDRKQLQDTLELCEADASRRAQGPLRKAPAPANQRCSSLR